MLTGAFDPMLLACQCGNGGEWAKQIFNAASNAYGVLAGVGAPISIPPCRDMCRSECGYGSWGIVPGVEAVVLSVSRLFLLPEKQSCPACLGTGKVDVVLKNGGFPKVRRRIVREE